MNQDPTLPLAAEPPLAVAPAVPGYALLTELGRGGMGVVYQSRQLGLDRVVALKMILAGGHAGEGERARFRTEAEAIARLRHPHIVEIHDFGEHEGRPFFALEFCAGGSLEQKIKGTPLPPREATRLVELLAGAMHAAHGQGVVHRDLKPANVLLTADGQPKITDFGLAKRLDGTGMTATGAVMGTPSYMAPEQAEGEKEVGPAADVYALGAILYELLTGRPPFKAATAVETLMQVVADEPVPPSRLQPKTPRDLETICLKCLQKDPGRRYATAAELADDLHRFQAGEPIRARPVGALERGWRWCRRNPAVATATTLAVLAVVAAVVIAVGAAIREGENAALVARQELASERQGREREQREREKDRERLRDSFIEQARAERLAGNRARALDALRKAADIRRDNVLRLETSATVMRPGLHFLGEIPLDQNHSGGAGFSSLPVISPDGNLVAVHRGGGFIRQPGEEERIEVLELPSGKLVRRKSGAFYTVAFRPGTEHLALVPSDRTPPPEVVLWDPRTDRQLGTFHARPDFVSGAAFSTDGSRLLTKHWKGMRVWDLSEKREAKVPAQGEFQGFLSGHDLLLLDQARYRTWDCQTGQGRWVAPDGFRAAGFSAAARLAALRDPLAGAPGGALHIWDLAKGKRVGEISRLSQFPFSVDFSPNGRYLVFDDPADPGRSMRVWDLRLREFTNRLNPPRGRTVRTAGENSANPSFNPDGSLLASLTYAERRTSLCVWDTAAGDVLATLPDVSEYQWSGDGRRLIVSTNPALGCWEATRPPPSYELGKAVKSLSLNGNGDRLAINQFGCVVVAGRQAPELVRWEAAEEGLFPQFVGRDERWAVRLTASPDPERGRRLELPVFLAGNVGLMAAPSVSDPYRASSALFPRIFELFPTSAYQTGLWRLAPQRRSVALPRADYPDYAKWAEDAARQTPALLQPWTYRLDSVESIRWAFSPKGPLLLRAGKVTFRKVNQPWESDRHTLYRPVVELWNYQAGERLAILGENGVCFQFSPDGRRFATSITGNVSRVNGSLTGQLAIWDTATCQVERVLRPQAADELAFSPDGRRLLAVNGGERAGLFDVDTGRQVQTWKGGKGDWQAFALNPDGSLVASGGEDKKIHLWDAATGRELARWQGHDGGVTALLFSRDGQTLYSGGQDGILKLWDLPFLRRELKALQMDW